MKSSKWKNIHADILAWCEWKKVSVSLVAVVNLFLRYPEFRKLMDFRLTQMGGGYKYLRFLTYPLSFYINLYISEWNNKGGIKGGLLFEHVFSTIIFCKELGERCCINQQVTIGTGRGGAPTIGNRVRIYSGAKIIGDITIGDDVIIGANCVVNKSIPSHSVVVGVPARIVKTRKNENSPWISINLDKVK